MPRLSEFYGIVIYMYYKDHAPPHVHAFYGGQEAVFEIATGVVSAGSLPRRARSLVEAWLVQNQTHLMIDWNLATSGQPLFPIAPLD